MPSAAQMPACNHGELPSAASRIAATPHVGASAKEKGLAQPGSMTTGTRNPHRSQPGNSSRLPIAQAVR